MKKLIVTVIADGNPDPFTYEEEIPDAVADNERLQELIAEGLLFSQGWSNEDISYSWKIV